MAWRFRAPVDTRILRDESGVLKVIGVAPRSAYCGSSLVARLPGLTSREVVRALKRAGFEEHHQKGGHLILRHRERGLFTCVPVHPGDLKRPLVKAIIKQAGMTEDEFRAHL